MYAVIDNKGQQYKVELGEEVLMDRLDTPEGELVQFDRVLMVSGEEDQEPRIGQPQVEGARVLGEVLRHERGPKLTGVRYKGPTQTKMGHRQDYTRVKIREIHPE
jgi:large subunit ribosomal protein L21